ncbi:MAG: Gldg family protein [Planctomycetota bacterium]
MSERKSMTRGTRVSYGVQVLVAVVLATIVGLLVMEVADWSYVRVDLSERGRNSIDPATVERIGNLEDELVIETFFRPLARPYDAVSAEALRRVSEFLFLVATNERATVTLRHNDMTDAATVQERQRELGVQGENLFVVRYGERKAVVRVFGEAVVINWGNPTGDLVGYLTERGIANVVNPRTWRPNQFEPARLVSVRTEEVLAEAVARVSAAEAPRVYLSKGQGERDPAGTLVGSVRALAGELERDGFAVSTWDPTADGAVPADCELLAILGPTQPFRPDHLDYVRGYVDSGGRLVAAVGLEPPTGRGTLVALLEDYGLRYVPGVVCQEVTNVLGQLVEGAPECAVLMVDAQGMSSSHPVTDALRRRDRRLLFSNSPSLERGASPQGGQLLDLVFSSRESWRDERDARTGGYNYALDQGRGERKGRYSLAALAQFRATASDVVGPPGEVREARVLAVASAAFFSDGYFQRNRDFLRGAFNWMVERDYRVDVAPRSFEGSAIDVARGSELATLTWLLWLVLPGLCIVVGGFVSWRRRR